MTNEEKSTVLATARATLQRLNGGGSAIALDPPERRVTNPDPAQQQRGYTLPDDEMARWRDYVESHVAQEIATEHEFVMQIVARALGEFSAQLGAEVGRQIASQLGPARG